MWECNGTDRPAVPVQQKDVQFASIGTGQVQVVGKCLDAPDATAGARVQLFDCNGTDPATGDGDQRRASADAGPLPEPHGRRRSPTARPSILVVVRRGEPSDLAVPLS